MNKNKLIMKLTVMKYKMMSKLEQIKMFKKILEAIFRQVINKIILSLVIKNKIINKRFI